ncbi:alpha/beta fold hydrolase [Streptomyces sp. NPDC014734]|uniref:alpha/beta fold hydrolase n=1 Tax=Streptomyces sp. NPDC014734 TaxID=3364886 RepID=UPI0036F9EF30
MTARTDDAPDRAYLTTPDGVRLRVRSAGDPARSAVLIASACGMPVGLCDAWVRFLARDHHVLTWETRGLSDGGCEISEGAFDALGHQVADQVEDMKAVLDHFQVGRAHVMGLCGGATLALRMAAEHPGPVASLSLWHGDFELGPDSPRSGHQRNLQALLDIAVESRQSATTVHAALLQNARAGLPPDIAHLVLHPYRDAETFYRYARLNGALMSEDVRAVLPGIAVPALVVTSEDDRTTHPAGSRGVAAALPHAQLHVEPHGDHISLFAAGTPVTDAARRFLAAAGRV